MRPQGLTQGGGLTGLIPPKNGLPQTILIILLSILTLNYYIKKLSTIEIEALGIT